MSKPSTLLSCPTLVYTDLYVCILDRQMLNPHIHFLEIKKIYICTNYETEGRKRETCFQDESELMSNSIERHELLSLGRLLIRKMNTNCY